MDHRPSTHSAILMAMLCGCLMLLGFAFGHYAQVDAITFDRSQCTVDQLPDGSKLMECRKAVLDNPPVRGAQ